MKIELWSYLNHWYWIRLNYDLWLDYLQIFFSLMFVSSASRVYGEAAAALVCWGFFLRWGTSKVLPSRSPLSSLSAPCIILPREQWKLSNLILPHFSWYCRCHLSRLMAAFPPLWRSLLSEDLSFTFSLLSGTNCSSSFPWFLPVHSPEAASGHPAQH